MKAVSRRTLLSLAPLLAGIHPAPALPTASAASHPNIAIIMLDDLDASSVSVMETAISRISAEGMTFSNAFATTPICGPSRASLLRGQYAHNHGGLRNTGDISASRAFANAGLENETLGTLLQDANYRTALIGKYLNGYAPPEGPSHFPPGWDYWVSPTNHDAYRGFRYDMNINGQVAQFGSGNQDYMTDVLARYASEFLDQALTDNRPFLLLLTPYAPHAPANPAPRHKGAFAGEKAPRSPAFNERNNRDKASWLRQSPLITKSRIRRLDRDYRSRLESLLAVDEMIGDVMDHLERNNALANTYVIFLSDNGYFLGDFRQPNGKDAAYDGATRVPLFIRGPGIPAGSETNLIAANIDILPTALQLANVATPGFVDGRSLAPIWQGSAQNWRQHILLEGFGKETGDGEATEGSTPPFRAIRSLDGLYVEYPKSDEIEYFDLDNDPNLLKNSARTVSRQLKRAYKRLANQASTCGGDRCREVEDATLEIFMKS